MTQNTTSSKATGFLPIQIQQGLRLDVLICWIKIGQKKQYARKKMFADDKNWLDKAKQKVLQKIKDLF